VIVEFEAVLQKATAYAVSGDIQEAQTIPQEQVFVGPSGTQFKTSPGLATRIGKAGEALSSGITSAGEYVSAGIVHAGQWWRSRAKPNAKPTQISLRTMNRCLHRRLPARTASPEPVQR